MKYLKYLKYIIKHKYYVGIECFKNGVYWRGIMHDMSKFKLDEFIPYAKYFYGNHKSETIENNFNIAWLKHIHRNPHHWQHWILQEDSGNKILIEMSGKYIDEMIADWNGAGMAIIGKNNTRKWYLQNKKYIQLHPRTRRIVETCLSVINIDE